MKKMYLAIFLIILVAVVFAGCLNFSGALSTSTTDPEDETTYEQPVNTTAVAVPENTVPVVIPENTVPVVSETTAPVVVPENTTSQVVAPEATTAAPQTQATMSPATPDTTAAPVETQPQATTPPVNETPVQNTAPASSEYDILKSGTFHMAGTMTDKTGTNAPMEVAVTPGSIYMLSDFSGVPMGMLIKDNKVYMIYPDKKSYLELSDSLMSMAGLDVSELTNSESVNFTSYGKLSEADSVTEVVHNGRTCQVYHFNVDSGESRVYMDGTKLVRLASYDTSGRFITSTDITSITSAVPADKSAPPASYKAYKGMTGMFSFMTLLEGVIE